MKLEAIVTKSQFGELLDELKRGEIASVSVTTNNEGEQIPLVTATVSTDRLIGFVRSTSATLSDPLREFPSALDALWIDGHTKSGEWSADNMVGMIGIWREVGEDWL